VREGVTATRDVALITVRTGIIGVPDIAARIFVANASVRANIVMISAIVLADSICFVVQAADAVRTEKALGTRCMKDVQPPRTRACDRQSKRGRQSQRSEKTWPNSGIAGRVFSTLGNEGINMIAMRRVPRSTTSPSWWKQSGMEKPQALHRTFGLGQAESSEEVIPARRPPRRTFDTLRYSAN